jgi:hypothetical protein
VTKGGISLPTLVWLYLTALLYDRTSASCVALAESLETVSHDRLTSMLQADWSGQRLLESAVRTLFVWERGYLILDDTVIARPLRPPSWTAWHGSSRAKNAGRCWDSRLCYWFGHMGSFVSR